MFGFLKKPSKLKHIEQVIHTSHRGVVKRIDENRELLELLQQEAPDFLQKHPWAEGWIQGQDGFLTDLMSASEMKAPEMQGVRKYPRPWPGRSATKPLPLDSN